MDRLGIQHRFYILSGVFIAAVGGWACFFVSGGALGILALILLIYAGASFLAVKGLRGLLQGIESTIMAVNNGDTERAAPYNDRSDDIGDISRALAALIESFHMAKALDGQRVGEQGKLQTRKVQIEDEIKQFKALSDRSYGLVVGAAGELDGTFGDMTKIVMEAQSKSDGAARLSEETAHNVNQVAASSEELSSSSKEIAQRAAQSSQNAKEAMDKIVAGEQSAEELSKAAAEIGNVVGVISDIAEQTNLLALNATIEAARAGEAGKGFAVVASEVKMLSQGTSKATDTIREQVQGIQGTAKKMVDIINLLKQTIITNTDYTTSISAAIEEQHAITNEIAHNMKMAATNVNDISRNIADVKSITQKAGASAQDVQQASNMLTTQADALNKGIQAFIAKIQAE